MKLMADYGTMFQLILVVLVFVIIGVFFIVYLMVLSVRENTEAKTKAKQKLQATVAEAKTRETTSSCAHFLGYLAGRPKSEAIPDECFDCEQMIECISWQPEAESSLVEPEPSPQQD